MAICFCNRAAAYQSMSQIVDAIADCSVAIALNENYEKVGFKLKSYCLLRIRLSSFTFTFMIFVPKYALEQCVNS